MASSGVPANAVSSDTVSERSATTFGDLMSKPYRIGVAAPVDLLELSELLTGARPTTSGYSHPIANGIIRTLLSRGYEVVVYALSRDLRDVGRYFGEGLTIEVCPFRSHLWWGSDFLAQERASLLEAIERSPCDVIHAFWTYEFALAALGSGIPSVVTVQDWGPEILRHQPHPFRAVRLGMQWRVLRRAPSLTANSPYIANKIRRWYRRDVPVVPNGIVVPDRLPPLRKGQLRAIGSVNNGFSKWKNVQALLEAFSFLRDRRGGLVLRLVGTDYERGGLAHQWARSRGLDVGVEFIGSIPADEVANFMRSIDLLVHPSLEESFGMTLIEAIIQGTPVIGGLQSGAVPWVLGEGMAGTLVDVTDPDAIGRSVLDLPSDPAELDSRRHRALDYVRHNFSLGRVVDQYEEAYRGVLAGEVA
jgi:glycosyltransferase involved in cell wall biosynthesis